MAEAKTGDTVKVHYTGKLQDGSVFDSSVEREPLEFTIGSGQLIPGFEKAVIGMSPGDSKTAELAPDEAYGPHQDDAVVEVDKQQLPENMEPEVGQRLQLRHPNGQVVPVVVTDVTDSQVILDANHPLAGKDLMFDIELVEIV